MLPRAILAYIFLVSHILLLFHSPKNLWKIWETQQIFFVLHLQQLIRMNLLLIRARSSKYLFKVSKRNTRRRSKIKYKLTIKRLEQCHWRCSGLFIFNFEHISHIFWCFCCWLWWSKSLVGSLWQRCQFLILASQRSSI